MSPFHVNTYGEAQAETLGNKTAEQGLAVGAQTLEANRLKLDLAKQDLADAETVRKTVAQHGGDIEKALPALAGTIQPRTLQGLQSYITDHRAKISEIGKRDADARKVLTELDQQEADIVGHAMLGVRNAGYSPAMFDAALSDMEQHDRYKDEAGQIRQVLRQKPDSLKQIVDHLVSQSPKALEQARLAEEAAATAKHNQAVADETSRHNKAGEARLAFQDAVGDLAANPPANAAEYRARVGRLTPEIAGRILQAIPAESYDPKSSPQAIRRLGMTAEQQTQADQAADNARRAAQDSEVDLARSATDPTKTPEERAAANAALRRLDQSKREARPVIQNVLPGLPGAQGGAGAPGAAVTGEEFLKALSPGLAAQVRAIAEGRAAMPSASTRSQAAVQLRDAVFRYDPSYSDQRAQVRRAFTSGSDGRNIGALNTATVHLDQFADAAAALQNGSFRPGNQAWNTLRTMFGSSAPTNFAALKSAVAGEMANALKGNATDIEIHNVAQSIDAANGAQQLADVIQTNLHVLAAKLQTYRERYQQQIPGDTVWSPVLPSAQAVYDKHSVAAGIVGGGEGGGAGQALVIEVNGRRYQYKGTGSTADLSNYTEVRR